MKLVRSRDCSWTKSEGESQAAGLAESSDLLMLGVVTLVSAGEALVGTL